MYGSTIHLKYLNDVVARRRRLEPGKPTRDGERVAMIGGLADGNQD